MNALDMGYEPHKRETWSKRYGELMRPVSFHHWDGVSRDKTGAASVHNALAIRHPAKTTERLDHDHRTIEAGAKRNA